jgi:recombinational DNA repair ATPase RecF
VKLKNIRIRNFRTVGTEQSLDLENGLTIVGPNSTGKTNLLRAVEMLFTGVDNRHGYDAEHDLTFGEATAQTGMIATFAGSEKRTMIFLISTTILA